MSLYQRYQDLQSATDLACQEAQNWDTLAEAVLSDVVLETIKRYQQKLNVGVADSVADLLDTFKQKVSTAIFEMDNEWRAASKTELLLYPRGCRFCYNRGHNTIIVIEQDPQVRSLSMPSEMLGEEESRGGYDTRVALALPYSIFFFHFREGRFSHLYLGWRNRTLSSLNDEICRPVLPNLHDNLEVCLGRGNILTGSIDNQVRSVLHGFWGSQFNSDLSSHWWNKGNLDQRIRSANSWHDLSLEDPMFILSVPFRRYKTVQEMVDFIAAEETVDESEFRHRLGEQIDQHVEGLFNKIMRYFKKTKFERHAPKDIKQEIGKHVGEVAQELVEVIHALHLEIDSLKEEVRCEPPDTEPKSEFWSEYSP
jgi:hypothetical protein